MTARKSTAKSTGETAEADTASSKAASTEAPAPKAAQTKATGTQNAKADQNGSDHAADGVTTLTGPTGGAPGGPDAARPADPDGDHTTEKAPANLPDRPETVAAADENGRGEADSADAADHGVGWTVQSDYSYPG